MEEKKEIIKKDIKIKSLKFRGVIFTVLVFILLLILSIAITPLEMQNDTFYTIKCGQYIFENGIFNLTEDPFSWVELPYTFPHWLYDLGIFIVYLWFDFKGIYISTIILATILGYTIYKNSDIISKNKVVSLAISLLSIYMLRDYITARAQLVTFILFSWELYTIEKLIETKKKRYLINMIIIPFLITQLHCAVFPMFFVLSMPYVGEYLLIKLLNANVLDNLIKLYFKFLVKITKKEERKQKYNEKIKKVEIIINNNNLERKKRIENPYKIIFTENRIIYLLIIVLILAGFVGFLNPAGTGAYTYLIKTYQGNTTDSINEHLPLTLVESREFAIILIIFIVILCFTKLKIRMSDLFMIGGLLYLSFTARRQISLFIIMCMPILAKLLVEIIYMVDKELLDKIYKFMTQVTGAIIIILLMTIYGENSYRDIMCQSYVNESEYPIQASNWILENLDIENLRLFNGYNYGSYLLMRGIPVFIDSRCDLYTPQFNGNEDLDIFSEALSIPDINGDYSELFEKYDINYAMFYRNDKVCQIINADSNYIKAYEDDNFIIYQRVNLNESTKVN